MQSLMKFFSAGVKHITGDFKGASQNPAARIDPVYDAADDTKSPVAPCIHRSKRESVHAVLSVNARPFIMVYLGNERDITRGDVNGYIGIAKRTAALLGAEIRIIDDADISRMYPHCAEVEDAQLQFFKDNGCPDILFEHRPIRHKGDKYLLENGTGYRIRSVNEHLRSALKVPSGDIPFEIVAHNLTPEVLSCEGQRFAAEYQELPRPFIGINYVNLGTQEAYVLGKKLTSLKEVYGEATFFICSSHRTSRASLYDLTHSLREGLIDVRERFPVIEFDFPYHAENEGMDKVWNPYRGLLDQADHLILAGVSYSTLSEMIATGKTAYSWDWTMPMAVQQKGWGKRLESHVDGMPLETERCQGVTDMTEACARALVAMHKKHREYVAHMEGVIRTKETGAGFQRYFTI